jgi:hypothetical protein
MNEWNGWNHRLVDMTQENDGDPLFVFREVYYQDDTPVGHCEPSMMSETLQGMQELIDRLREATTLPILKAEDFKKGAKK